MGPARFLTPCGDAGSTRSSTCESPSKLIVPNTQTDAKKIWIAIIRRIGRLKERGGGCIVSSSCAGQSWPQTLLLSLSHRHAPRNGCVRSYSFPVDRPCWTCLHVQIYGILDKIDFDKWSVAFILNNTSYIGYT